MNGVRGRIWQARWAFVPVVLLVVSVGGMGAVAAIAADDPSFSLEPDYYQKAVAWDQHQAERAASARLGWKLEAALELEGPTLRLVARVTAADGSPLSSARVQAHAFAIARASDLRELVFVERRPGEYTAELGRARPGLWEFRFAVEQGTLRYSTVTRAEVPKGVR